MHTALTDQSSYRFLYKTFQLAALPLAAKEVGAIYRIRAGGPLAGRSVCGPEDPQVWLKYALNVFPHEAQS
jgi:hypothetical protein